MSGCGKSVLETAVPFSLEYWIARSSGNEIIQVLLKQGDQDKINEILGFLGVSEIVIGNINTPGDNIGDLLIITE